MKASLHFPSASNHRKVDEPKRETLWHYSAFFARYASYMLGCGATCIRISKNLHRMARHLNLQCDMIILSHHVTVVLTDHVTGQSKQYTRKIAKIGANFEMNTRLSHLSWKIADGEVTISEAEDLFDRIIHTPTMDSSRVMWLVVLANASFCRLFGGDFAAMGIVAAATLVGYYVKILLLQQKFDDKFVWLVCAFLSSMVGTMGFFFPSTDTPDWAVAASVLYLIPGIPYINSVSDFIDGHYLCGFGRLIHAFALTICIATGLTLSFLIMHIRILF